MSGAVADKGEVLEIGGMLFFFFFCLVRNRTCATSWLWMSILSWISGRKEKEFDLMASEWSLHERIFDLTLEGLTTVSATQALKKKVSFKNHALETVVRAPTCFEAVLELYVPYTEHTTLGCTSGCTLCVIPNKSWPLLVIYHIKLWGQLENVF